MIETNTLITIFEAIKSIPSESFESETLEFKEYSSEKSLHNAKDLTEEISALANRQGGAIVVGIKDSCNVKNNDWASQLTGFQHVDLNTTKERLIGKLRPKMLELELSEHEFENKNYLIIHVPNRVDTLVGTSNGKFYIREGKSSRPMEPDEIKNAVKALQDYDWSAEILSESPETMLDHASVKEAYDDFCVRRNAGDTTIDSFYEAIGITVNGKLTKSGLLMFGTSEAIKDKLGNFEYRYSKKDSTGELLTNEIWNDCLWVTIKKGKQYFTDNNTYIDLEYKGKTYTIPHLDNIAFHEAFINSLVHRDYSIDGMVTIEFSGKKLSITSPGCFYGGINSENIFNHEPRHRNKALARMLMVYHLVDRAGMGVFRMSLNSLKYGREFPVFIENNDSVAVVMQAEYLKAPIFLLSCQSQDSFGIPEYLILNLVFKTGYTPVSNILLKLVRIKENPWETLKQSVNNIDEVELCGDKKGIYVRVKPEWNSFLDVTKTYRVYAGSNSYVKLFDFLQQHGSASNANIKALLGHTHTPTTSKFLRNISYIKRTGKGVSATWSLITG